MATRFSLDNPDPKWKLKTPAARVYNWLVETGKIKPTITSGYRTPEHNRRVKGNPNSYHMQGLAIDLLPGEDIDKVLSDPSTVQALEDMGYEIIDERNRPGYGAHWHLEPRPGANFDDIEETLIANNIPTGRPSSSVLGKEFTNFRDVVPEELATAINNFSPKEIPGSAPQTLLANNEGTREIGDPNVTGNTNPTGSSDAARKMYNFNTSGNDLGQMNIYDKLRVASGTLGPLAYELGRQKSYKDALAKSQVTWKDVELSKMPVRDPRRGRFSLPNRPSNQSTSSGQLAEQLFRDAYTQSATDSYNAQREQSRIQQTAQNVGIENQGKTLNAQGRFQADAMNAQFNQRRALMDKMSREQSYASAFQNLDSSLADASLMKWQGTTNALASMVQHGTDDQKEAAGAALLKYAGIVPAVKRGGKLNRFSKFSRYA